MYVRVCQECVDEHQDIINKKISKGSVWGANLTDDKDECYLAHMHDEVKEVSTQKDKMKVNFMEQDKWVYAVGMVNLQGYASLIELLNNSRFIEIEYDGELRCINANRLMQVWENTDKDEEGDD